MCRSAQWSAVLVAGVLACSQPALPQVQEAPPADSDAPLQQWPMYAELARFKEVARGPSEHWAGRAFARVLVNAEGRPYADGCVTLEPGAVIVASLSSEPESTPSEHFVMERSERGWLFFTVADGGKILNQSNDLCARCHAEAPSEQLFGTTRQPRKNCMVKPSP